MDMFHKAATKSLKHDNRKSNRVYRYMTPRTMQITENVCVTNLHFYQPPRTRVGIYRHMYLLLV